MSWWASRGWGQHTYFTAHTLTSGIILVTNGSFGPFDSLPLSCVNVKSAFSKLWDMNGKELPHINEESLLKCICLCVFYLFSNFIFMLYLFLTNKCDISCSVHLVLAIRKVKQRFYNLGLSGVQIRYRKIRWTLMSINIHGIRKGKFSFKIDRKTYAEFEKYQNW